MANAPKRIICKCGFRFYPEDGVCPVCDSTPSKSNKVGKPKPKRRIRKRSEKRLNQNKSQQSAMKDFARKAKPECIHCGIRIREMKYENIDHIIPKSEAPSLIAEPSNMRVLCGDMDMIYYKSIGVVEDGEGSCHHIRHHGTDEQWESKRNKYRSKFY